MSLIHEHDCCATGVGIGSGSDRGLPFFGRPKAAQKAPLLLKEGWPRLCEVGVVNGRRASEIASSAAKWFLPGAILVLIPKCPLCIVAYVAMFSGIGLSVSTASGLRIAMITLSTAALVYLTAHSILRFRKVYAFTRDA